MHERVDGRQVRRDPPPHARVGQSLAGGDDLQPFADRAFRAVPLYFGRPWFLPLVGAYYKLKDAVR